MNSDTQVRPLADHEFPQWQRLVHLSPDSCAYHDLRWLQAVCRGVGDRLVLMGLFIGAALAAGLPLQVRKRGPLTLARRPFATPYANPIHDPDVLPNPTQDIQTFLKRAARAFSCLTVTGSPFATLTSHQTRGTTLQKHTFVVDVHDPDHVWASLGCPLRKKITRTLREGYTAVDGCPPDAFYRLYHDTYTRQGLADPFSEASFIAFLVTLTTGGLGRTFSVLNPEGNPCVARLVIQDNVRTYCALSGSDAPRTGDHPAELLLWHTMQHLAPGHNQLDLVGANIPRIIEFKRKFGGRLLSYPETTHYRTLFEKQAIRLYQKIGTVTIFR